MGLFKSKDEKLAEQQKIRDSEVTQMLCAWLIREFSDMQGERVYNLRQGNGYRLDVYRNGIVLTLFGKKGAELDKEGITFAGLGFNDLPNNNMVSALSDELFDALRTIPHLYISRPHIFGNSSIKQSW